MTEEPISESDVLVQNEAFYAAFRDRNVAAMTELWATSTPVSCIHPSWDALIGRDQVIASWLAILGDESSPQIRCENATAWIAGDVAWVVCNEIIKNVLLTATNVFVREEGEWRIVHHHASPTASAPAAPPMRKDFN
jgi:ketosteroid isomerase-like protein